VSEQQEKQGHRVFVAVPWYQTLPGECIYNHDDPAAPPHYYHVYRRGEAYVDRNFSTCWAAALNSRHDDFRAEDGSRVPRGDWDVFSMVHVDVAPHLKHWLNQLLAEYDRSGADLLSVVLPIKTHHGMTSTCLMDTQGRVRRVTMEELYELPPTFDSAVAGKLLGDPEARLMVSTGMWVCRFDQAWVEELWFETKCRIIRDDGGTFVVRSFPEDWHFSLLMHALGLKVMATRVIGCEHMGIANYTNARPWGTQKHDTWKIP
jgi:hypothetical protein